MATNQSMPAPDDAPTHEAVLRETAEQLYRERVHAARIVSAEEKLLAGEELFDYACAITLAGIRNQFPGATDDECKRVLEERLALRERMERDG